MWSRAFAMLALTGCAQVAGIETTSKGPPDARLVDAAIPSDVPLDARVCAGGDARTVDPATGTCYTFFTAPMTRNQARSTCSTFGAANRLASVQSAAESTLITNLIGASEAFLGGSDEAIEGAYVWEDGTPVQLTRWNTGEPNNGQGMIEEDCIVMIGALGGVWDDRPCAPPPINTGAYPFVCERN